MMDWVMTGVGAFVSTLVSLGLLGLRAWREARLLTQDHISTVRRELQL